MSKNRYVEIVEINEKSAFKNDVMKEKGYLPHSGNHYNIPINEFAKLKMLYEDIDLKKRLKPYIIHLQDIPRNDRIMVKCAKKHGIRVLLVKMGTKYKIDCINSYRGYVEKITLEHDIDWKIA